MRIRTGDVELNLRVKADGPEDRSHPVVCLHGMTLSGRDWEPVRSRLEPDRTVVAPDLIGHGQSEAPERSEPYRVDSVIDRLLGMVDELGIEAADWVGYSMGGRILLHLALEAPDRVDSLVLESTTAGLEDSTEREKRRTKDRKLARYLEDHSLEAFVDRWLEAPVFESQRDLPEEKRRWARETRLEADPAGLARALRQLSRGRVPAVWDRLERIRKPVLLVTGERDEKHRNLHSRMEARLPRIRSEIIAGAGHNVHFEQPQRFVELVRTFWG